jgi:hypothetical protein
MTSMFCNALFAMGVSGLKLKHLTSRFDTGNLLQVMMLSSQLRSLIQIGKEVCIRFAGCCLLVTATRGRKRSRELR